MEKIGIFIPAYNEQETLEEKIGQLDAFVRKNVPQYTIVIADNNSTDTTGELAKRIARSNKHVVYHFVPQRGKGAAIKYSWLSYDYDIYSFMDVDLSTDLKSFPSLIENIKNGYDIAIGSRYTTGADAKRTLKRELISRGYRMLFHALFKTDIADPQCGFKAINKKVRDVVVPQIEENGFFFDTELLMRAHRAGYTIKEVPVLWTEDAGSTLNFRRDIPKFVNGLIRLKRQLKSK